MIFCSPTPASIIKAALLAKLHNDLPCIKGEETCLGLFALTESHDANRFSLRDLTEQLRLTCGLQADWLVTDSGRTLLRHINANLRYSAVDRSAVIFAAAEQSLIYGPAYTLCGIGDISRIFVLRTRAVAHEIHRMTGFIRFSPGEDDRTLIAVPQLFHQTADLILKRLAVRYPSHKLVFLLNSQALVLENKAITCESVDPYQAYVTQDNFKELWETYYRSQYITTRKNMKLASRVIPKKYWSWLAEGKILAQEAGESARTAVPMQKPDGFLLPPAPESFP